MHRDVSRYLDGYRPRGADEERDLERCRLLLGSSRDPWDRHLPLHLTASAVVVDVASRKVLLRWHARQRAWLHLGGHADPGEVDPVDVALREAREESGLEDLAVWPSGEGAQLIHLAAVPVAPRGDEPAHEHADLRYLMTTSSPGGARAENDEALLRWTDLADAAIEVTGNLAETLRRVAAHLGSLPAHPGMSDGPAGNGEES